MRWAAGGQARGFAYNARLAQNPEGFTVNDRIRRAYVSAGKEGPWSVVGKLLEVVVVSEEAPERPNRLVRPSNDQAVVANLGKQAVIPLRLKRGKRVEGGFVGGGVRLVGRLKVLRGRLPKGVRLHAKSGALPGIPREKGVFDVVVRGRYGAMKSSVFLSPRGVAGVHSNAFRISVR